MTPAPAPRICHRLLLLTVLAALAPAAHAQVTLERDLGPMAELPMRAPLGLPFVQVGVGESAPRWFGFDTGATHTCLDRAWVRDLRLTLGDAGGRAPPGKGTMQLGELRWADRSFGAIDLIPLASAVGRRLWGILGADLLQTAVVELDYAAARMRLYAPDAYRYAGRGHVFDVAIEKTKVLVPMRIRRRDGTEVTGTFLVDTGSTQAIGLSPHFYRGLLTPGQPTVEARGWRFGGAASTGRLLRLASIQLGPFSFDDVVAHAVVDESKRSWDGSIGGEVLRRFKVILDRSRSRMMLEPNGAIHEPARESLTGMELAADGPDQRILRVFSVYAGSPAARAGVARGDVLLEIDGEDAASYGLDGLWERWRAGAGSVHQLLMRRGDTERVVSIELERLPL
ncbi:MAG: aspartyl protease family protein [Planctomycetota bacterium]